MSSDNPHLTFPSGRQPKAKPPFKVGALVALKTCTGQGRVTGTKRGRVLVSWDTGYLGRHAPLRLW